MKPSLDDTLTRALLEELAAADASIQRAIRTLAAIYSTDNPTTLARVKALYEAERRPEIPAEEKQEMSKMKLFTLMVMVLLALLLGGSVLAQEDPFVTNTTEAGAVVTLEPTAYVVTSEPVDGPVVIGTAEVPGDAPVVVVQQPDDNAIYVIGFLIFTLFSGAVAFLQTRQFSTIVTSLNKAMESKQVIDQAHEQYYASSLPTQEFVKLLGSFAQFVGSANIPGIDPLADSAAGFIDKVITPDLANEIKARAADIGITATSGGQPYSRNVAVPGQTRPLDDEPGAFG